MPEYNNLNKVELDLLERGIVELDLTLNTDAAIKFREAMSRLAAKGSPDIELRITSRGGIGNSGLDIYDRLIAYEGCVTGIVHGFANSMAAVVLQACNTRICMPNASVLVHNVRVDGETITLDLLRSERKVSQLREQLEREQAIVDQIISDRTGKSLAAVGRMSAKDKSMSATEALEFGLVDRIGNNAVH